MPANHNLCVDSMMSPSRSIQTTAVMPVLSPMKKYELNGWMSSVRGSGNPLWRERQPSLHEGRPKERGLVSLCGEFGQVGLASGLVVFPNQCLESLFFDPFDVTVQEEHVSALARVIP